MPKILVVDDDNDAKVGMEKKLKRQSYDVFSASNAGEAVKLIKAEDFDVVVADMVMEHDKAGLDVLDAAKEKNESTEVIIITAYGKTPTAFDSSKKGAFAYIEKDDENPYDLLCAKVKEAIQRKYIKSSSNQNFLKNILYGAGSVMDILAVSQSELQKLYDPDSSINESLSKDFKKVDDDLKKAFEKVRLEEYEKE